MDNFSKSSEQLHMARNFTVGIEFWNNVLCDLVAEHNTLSAEQAAIGSGNVTSTTKTEQNGFNE
jgi:hypothetical protein